MSDLFWCLYARLTPWRRVSAGLLTAFSALLALAWVLTLTVAVGTHNAGASTLFSVLSVLLLADVLVVALVALDRVTSLTCFTSDECDAIDTRLTRVEQRLDVQDEIERELIEAAHTLNEGKQVLEEALGVLAKEQERKARRRQQYADTKKKKRQERGEQEEQAPSIGPGIFAVPGTATVGMPLSAPYNAEWKVDDQHPVTVYDAGAVASMTVPYTTTHTFLPTAPQASAQKDDHGTLIITEEHTTDEQ